LGRFFRQLEGGYIHQPQHITNDQPISHAATMPHNDGFSIPIFGGWVKNAVRVVRAFFKTEGGR
jgi:hypothetical protein